MITEPILYDMENDVGETTNVAGYQPEVVEAMLKELVTWRAVNQIPLPPSSQLKI